MGEEQGGLGVGVIKTGAAVQETAGGPLQFGWKINTPGGSCGADHKVTHSEITATDSHGDTQTTFMQVPGVPAEGLHGDGGRRRFILHVGRVRRASPSLIKAKKATWRSGGGTPERHV